MFNKLTHSGLYVNCRRAVLIFLTGGSLSLQIACKDNNNNVTPDGQQADPTAVIPASGKNFNYKVSDAYGSTYNEVTRVKSVSDSAGLKVSNLETRTSGTGDVSVLNWKAYSQNGITTNEIPLPSALTGLMDQIRQLGTVKDFRITGFPQYQKRENKTVTGSKLTFKGDDIKIYVKLDIENGDGETVVVEVESTLTYKNGEVTKVETLTTPAGTFNCSKWEYGYSYVTKVFYDGQAGDETNEIYTVTDWTTAGVGVVKSIERTGGTESVTELQKID